MLLPAVHKITPIISIQNENELWSELILQAG